MIDIRRFTLIRLEWNSWNGFIFELFAIELDGYDGSLLGFNWGWNCYLQLSLFFITIDIKKPFY